MLSCDFDLVSGNDAADDADGWTGDAIKTLCELHIPKLAEYNSGNFTSKKDHWKVIKYEMNAKGFRGGCFTASDKIGRKWRYIFSKYNQVKDNNGKTGRGKMKFKHFDTMHAIFRDSQAGGVVTDPQIVNNSDEAPQVERRSHGGRGGNSANSEHLRLMREMTGDYHKKSLELQAEAIQLEREKIGLLQRLLERP